jgi:hypothetical protein
MSLWLLICITAIYAGIAANEASKGNWSDAWIFAAYSAANFGFMARLI